MDLLYINKFLMLLLQIWRYRSPYTCLRCLPSVCCEKDAPGFANDQTLVWVCTCLHADVFEFYLSSDGAARSFRVYMEVVRLASSVCALCHSFRVTAKLLLRKCVSSACVWKHIVLLARVASTAFVYMLYRCDSSGLRILRLSVAGYAIKWVTDKIMTVTQAVYMHIICLVQSWLGRGGPAGGYQAEPQREVRWVYAL